MMQGYPLSANLPEDSGLGERFWYWRGASGQSYIHSIYAPDLCPPVPGAAFVVVRNIGGERKAQSVGRFGADGAAAGSLAALKSGDEVHVHLLTRDEAAAEQMLRDLEAALTAAPVPRPEAKGWRKPVQLELLAA